MCLAVYVGSDARLPEIPWNKDDPAFHLLQAGSSDPARRQFRGPYVYCAGSHEGCGCGFLKYGEQAEALACSQSNYDALRAVLGSALRAGASVQLFTCWDGDQAAPPESVRSIGVSLLASPAFELKERELLDVADDAEACGPVRAAGA